MDPNKRITSEQAMADVYFSEEPRPSAEWVYFTFNDTCTYDEIQFDQFVGNASQVWCKINVRIEEWAREWVGGLTHVVGGTLNEFTSNVYIQLLF